MNNETNQQASLVQQLLQNNNLQILAVIVLLIVAAMALTIQTSQPELCQLFEGYIPTATEKSRILIVLGKSNLNDYSVENGNILVPYSQKPKYLSAIQDEDAVPQSLQKEKEATANPFLPKSQQAALAFERKKRQIRDLIQRLPFVAETWFEMDWAPSDSVYQPDVHSAVVMVTLKESLALTRQQVTTIQGIVGGAIAKINPNQVVVTDANIGISYHDLNDHNQSELIELVNWKMNRKIYYMEQLQDLVEQYPGMRIEIDVRAEKKSSKPEHQPQIAKNPPVKLAGFNGEITLNNSGEADAPGQAISIPSRIDATELENLQLANHIANVASSGIAESLVIRIHVPIEHTIPIESIDTNTTSDHLQRLEQFKLQLAKKIRTKIGHNNSDVPVQLMFSILDERNGKEPQLIGSIPEALQLYWPLCAVVIIGIGTVLFSRRPAPTAAPIEKVSQSNSDMNSEQLQNQLTELIDKDPESAAQVIKNWIRDAG